MIMKKWTLSILFSLSSLFAFSQFHAGLRAGLSSSEVEINENVEGINISTGDKNYGYHIGLFTQIIIKDKFVIMPEVLFSSTGGKIDLSNGTNVSEIWNLKYNRLDIPLNFGVKFLKIMRINAGPYAGILLNADANYQDVDQDVKDNYKNLVWGYQAGIGMDIWKLSVDLKYEGSFASYHNNNIHVFGRDINYSPDTRPNQWILSVGLRLF
jgi:hypothetical protein